MMDQTDTEHSPVELAARALAENDRGCDDDFPFYIADVDIMLDRITLSTTDMRIAAEEVCHLVAPDELQKAWAAMIGVLRRDCKALDAREFTKLPSPAP